MTARNSALAFIAALTLIIGAGSFFLGRYTVKKEYVTTEIRDTTFLSVVVRDTIRLIQYKERVRTDTCLVAVVRDSLIVEPDTVRVEVPIEQKTYETENYRAVIEGYRPQLVSMDIFKQMEVITIEKQIAPKKWSFSIALGASAGVFYTPAGLQPGAGLGATIGAAYHF